VTSPTVSVVVVSQQRPDALQLCLTGVLKLNYTPFEVIVVADQSGLSVAQGLSDQIKTVAFDAANICAARNAGLNAAGGQIVAFIDDDAVPEPQWLRHLIAPFARGDVAAAGGFVRGRNGITFQWKARMAFADGTSVPFDVDGMSIHKSTLGRAIKTEGTNMAFRRDALVKLGGFDPRFAFYLDETDVNMRLAAQGAKTAIVPLAQVHHGFAASARRTQDRVPRSLFEIGASSAVFASKHDPDAAQTRFAARRTQRNRLLRFMTRGDLVPSDVRKLMATFDEGRVVGAARKVVPVTIGPAPAFEPVHALATHSDHIVVSGRYLHKRKVLEEAARMAQDGTQVSAYVFTFTSIFHRVQFHVGGYWLQTGGQFGRSVRGSRLFQYWTQRSRVEHEVNRVKSVRET